MRNQNTCKQFHQLASSFEGKPMTAARVGPSELMPAWSFLTNHGLVLTYVGRNPDSTGLEIARQVGITERAVRKIVDDLSTAGYIEREKVGRRNRYSINVAR